MAVSCCMGWRCGIRTGIGGLGDLLFAFSEEEQLESARSQLLFCASSRPFTGRLQKMRGSGLTENIPIRSVHTCVCMTVLN